VAMQAAAIKKAAPRNRGCISTFRRKAALRPNL
jgi:hypothetical protein